MALQRRKPTQVPESTSGSIEYENLEQGDHEGRLVIVADLGLQHKEFKGEHMGNYQKIALGIEIVGKTFKRDGEVFPVMLWAPPFFVYDTLTGKGKEIVYAAAFDGSVREGQTFDWDEHLGEPVNVVVSHQKDKKDPSTVYDNIARLSAIPDKYKADVPPSTITPVSGDGEDVTKHFYGLVKFVYDQRLYEEEAVADAATPNLDPDAAFDDDIPF